MSTGADCCFYEQEPQTWFYRLQRWPYGETEDYDTFGPFLTFDAAKNHLDRNHANPGGYSVRALPGCPHDRLRCREFTFGNEPTHECLRCGEHLTHAE